MTQHISHHFASNEIRSNWVTVGWVVTPGEIKRVQDGGHDMEWLQDIAKITRRIRQ